MNIINSFDDFVQYCIEHGEHLRNHTNFGSMVMEFRGELEKGLEERDEMFFAHEGLVLDLCKELGLEYESSGKNEIIAKIKEIKNER